MLTKEAFDRIRAKVQAEDALGAEEVEILLNEIERLRIVQAELAKENARLQEVERAWKAVEASKGVTLDAATIRAELDRAHASLLAESKAHRFEYERARELESARQNALSLATDPGSFRIRKALQSVPDCASCRDHPNGTCSTCRKAG